jgi:hypothetical protein
MLSKHTKNEDKHMPNWVSNTLEVIKGDPKEVFEFVRSEKSLFDFNKLIPMPEHIKDSDEPVAYAGLEGVPAWYAWALDNWGTKWNACDAEYSTKDPERVLWFDTAWSPPVPVFEALAKRFPAHEIIVRSFECENLRHDTFTLKDGQVAWKGEDCDCFADAEDTKPFTAQELDELGDRGCPLASWHRAGALLLDLKKWLGHSDLKTTELYLAECDLESRDVRRYTNKSYIAYV